MTGTQAVDPARKKRLEESFIKHAALAQLYRWCRHHDLSGPDHADRIDLLSEEAVVKMADGTVGHRRDYWVAVSGATGDSRNAHFVRSCELDVMPDGGISLTAELDCHDTDSVSDDAVRKSSIFYRAAMTPLDGSLPRFAQLEISQEAGHEVGKFEDDRARNRLLSLVHYFTSLVENPARDPAPFRELLIEDFALHYVDPPVSDHAMLDAWVTGRLASVVASNHVIHDVSFEATGNDEYAVTVDMESEALFPDGSGVISKNRQSWLVVDKASERFARIREIRIDRDAVRWLDLPEAE